MNLSDWSRATGLSSALICYRLRAGWSVSDAVLSAPDPGRWARGNGRQMARPWTLGGVTKTLQEWQLGAPVSLSTIYGRLRRGWSLERSISEPIVTVREIATG